MGSQQKDERWLQKREEKMLKKCQKWLQKVPKKAENGGERGQPTKRKVGCKIMRNRTAKQREEWMQQKGQRGQPTRRQLAAKI